MADNESLFLLLRFLRAELRALKVDAIPPEKLVGLLEDISNALPKVTCLHSNMHGRHKLQMTIDGVNYAQKLAQRGSLKESALIGRSHVTNLLVYQDLFK